MKWAQAEKLNWRKEQTVKRSSVGEVVSQIQKLKNDWNVIQYGALAQNREVYPLYFLKSKNFDHRKRTVLITAGVHVCETSGARGALGFLCVSARQADDSWIERLINLGPLTFYRTRKGQSL